jgi:hypothetical protein
MRRMPIRWTLLVTVTAVIVLATMLATSCASGSARTTSALVPLQAAPSDYSPPKAVDVPPTGEANRVTTIAYHMDGSNNYILTWRYRMLGDYNLTLNVDVSDITPIAMHFGETWDPVTSPDSAAAVVDGSGNHTVGVEDITQIAMNYNKTCASYSIQGAAAMAGPYTEVGTAPCPTGSALANGWPEITFDLGPTPAYAWYQVVPLDTDNNPGIESLPVHIVPGGGGGLVLVLDTAANSGTGLEADPFLVTISTAYTVHCEDVHGVPITTGVTLHSMPPFFVDLVSISPFSVTATDLMAGDFYVWADTNDTLLTSNRLYFRVDQTLP